MQRLTRIILVGLLALAILPCLTHAAPICFQAKPFIDVFTFTTDVQSVVPLQISVTAAMEAPELYQLGGAGVVLVSDIEPIGHYAIRVPMANLGLFFGGNPVCALTATVSPSTFTGPWRLTCTGNEIPFSVPGTLVLIDCPRIVVVSQPSVTPSTDVWSMLQEVSQARIAGTSPVTSTEALAAGHAQGLTAAGEAENNELVP